MSLDKKITDSTTRDYIYPMFKAAGILGIGLAGYGLAKLIHLEEPKEKSNGLIFLLSGIYAAACGGSIYLVDSMFNRLSRK